MDVSTAFLYTAVDEEVYMEMVEGTSECSGGDKVLRLLKSIYGLKQASKMWNRHIDGILGETVSI